MSHESTIYTIFTCDTIYLYARQIYFICMTWTVRTCARRTGVSIGDQTQINCGGIASQRHTATHTLHTNTPAPRRYRGQKSKQDSQLCWRDCHLHTWQALCIFRTIHCNIHNALQHTGSPYVSVTQIKVIEQAKQGPFDICVTWLIQMCDMTHSYIFEMMCDLCDMAHSFVWHGSCHTRDTYLTWLSSSYVTSTMYISDNTPQHTQRTATHWLMPHTRHICDMTHSRYVCFPWQAPCTCSTIHRNTHNALQYTGSP